MNITAQSVSFRPSVTPASKAETQANTEPVASCQIQDLMTIGDEKPSQEKEQIIRSMIRQAPDCEAVTEVVEALSAYPTDALKRVQAFGTKLEIYDKDENGDGQEFPNYMPTLVHPLVNGAYNTKANVLGIEEDNLSPFVLLHEFAHALDASMGNISEQPEWKGAYKLACNTNQVVRDYAKQDPSEYFAENTSAFLVSDEALYTLVDEGLQKGIGLNGMDEREYMQTYQNFCKGRVERVDSNGFRLVDTLLHSLDTLPAPKAQPAMDQNQWQEFINQRAA